MNGQKAVGGRRMAFPVKSRAPRPAAMPRHVVVRKPLAVRAMWLIWLIAFVALSHKTKAFGEPALRPLYIGGILFACGALAYLAWRFVRNRGVHWRGAGGSSIVAVLFLVSIYIVAQAAMLFPESFPSSIYITSTAFVFFALAAVSIRIVGWEQALTNVLVSLLVYSFVNILATLVAMRYPHLLTEPGIVVASGGYTARPVGVVGDPTQLGALYAITLLLMFLLRERFRTAWLIPVAGILFVALILTGSRNGILSLVGGCAVALLAGRNFASALLKMIGAGYVIAVLSAALVMTPGVAEALAERAVLEERFRVGDPNAFSRLQVWKTSARIASEMTLPQQMFGGGLRYIYNKMNGSPYNAFLRLFFSHGIWITFAVVVAILLVVASAIVDRVTARRQAVLAMLTFSIAFSMFLDTIFARFFHFAELCFWLAVAVAATESSVGFHARHRAGQTT